MGIAPLLSTVYWFLFNSIQSPTVMIYLRGIEYDTFSKMEIPLNALRTIWTISLLLTSLLAVPSMADGPRDNIAADVRPVPPPGNQLAAADREELQAGVEKLSDEIQALKAKYAGKPEFLARVADVEIYFNAVRYPLKYHEAIDAKEARKALADGEERAAELRQGKTPWTLVSGPRGYVSSIDESVQPYVLLVPEEYKPETLPAVTPRRLERLLPRTQRNPHRVEIHSAKSQPRQGQIRSQSVWPVLQRQQVRRGNRLPGSHRFHQAAVPD